MSRGFLYLTTYLIVSVPLFFLCWLVYVANSKSSVNRSLIVTGMMGAIWLALLFYCDYEVTESSTYWDSWSMFGGSLLAISFYIFSIKAIYETDINWYLMLSILSLLLIDAILIFFIPDFVGKRIYSNGEFNFIGSTGYVVHLVLTFSILMQGVYQLKKKASLLAETDALVKYRLLIRGGAVAVAVNIFGEALFTIFDIEHTRYDVLYDINSALGILYFAVSATIAVLKHGLFDARRAAVRTLGYSVSLVTLAVIYGVALLAFTRYILAIKTSYSDLVFGVLLTVLVALTFPLIKNFFNKLTKRLFFRDSYESSEVLGSLNDMFISQPTLESILTESLEIISKNLVPSYAELYAVDQYRTYGKAVYGEKNITEKLALLRLLDTPWPESNLLVINDPNISKDEKEYLISAGADLMLRLSTKDLVVGYLLLAPRLNGDKYTDQDVDLLRIIAKNLSLAIQSAMQYAKIQDFNKTLKREVNVATKKLRKTNETLSRLSTAKDEMMSLVSHQLIPQLTATHGFIELMEKSKTNKDELIMLSLSSTARMTRLAQDMLNSTKMQSGDLELRPVTTLVNNLIQTEINNLMFYAEKHNVRIEFINKEEVYKELDAGLFSEALFNILDNAVQYSPAESLVRVKLTRSAIEVEDRGLGIPHAEQKRLFSKFFRAKNAKKYRPNGTGIGLYVAHKILTAHNFQINIKSKISVGTTVIINFDKFDKLVK